MSLEQLNVSKYRSLRHICLPLGQLNVITGPNGSGKSNLYRALWLLAQICEGDFARSIAREGGLLSAMWAGPRTNIKKPLRMSLGLRHAEFSYEMECGFPQPGQTLFGYDPEIKEEAVWYGRIRKPSTTQLERKNGHTSLRDEHGRKVDYLIQLSENESALAQLREPQRYPELFRIREVIRGWRFYHGFRTDEHSPLRTPQVSVRTPVLSHDGSDLAAALQTIVELGDRDKLLQSLREAFPGRRVTILSNEEDPYSKSPRSMELSVGMNIEGCARTLLARELSDGTLKFLCLAAALLSPRPPELIAINEPEASLHPDLIPSLARLIIDASQVSQVWISTHSRALAEEIETLSGVRPIELSLHEGETIVNADFANESE